MDATDTDDAGLLETHDKMRDVSEVKVAPPRFVRRLVPRKSWNELSPAQKVGNIMMAVVELTLLILALWDLAHRPSEAINGKKRTWAMVSFIQPFGPLLYFVFGRKR